MYNIFMEHKILCRQVFFFFFACGSSTRSLICFYNNVIATTLMSSLVILTKYVYFGVFTILIYDLILITIFHLTIINTKKGILIIFINIGRYLHEILQKEGLTFSLNIE